MAETLSLNDEGATGAVVDATTSAAALAVTSWSDDTLVMVLGIGLCGTLHQVLSWTRRDASGTSSAATTSLLSSDAGFRAFAIKYLSAFVLATSADWMMGPYIYALYESYGYTMGQIGYLFVVGFGSSMVFGTFLGGAADQIGRKTACMVYCVLMSVACIMKNFSDLNTLALGRVMGGTATSLLYSSFESWAVCAYNTSGLSANGLSQLFSLATFCNAFTAILSGFAAHVLAEGFGYVAPFNGAMVPLALCFVVVASSWTENYGDKEKSSSDSMFAALSMVFRERKVWALGLLSAMFEAVLFVFVFMWTPSLETRHDERVSHGMVFAIFMIFKMAGTWAFSILHGHLPLRTIASFVFILAGACLAVPTISTDYFSTLVALCMFEFCVGTYFPVVGLLKAELLDESMRAAVSSLFRVPLNLAVLVALGRIEGMEESTVYYLCLGGLGLSTACCMLLPLSTTPKQQPPAS
eukprot:m.76580 g.76580  ORF g.76580 m.76580 type:complete len:468 (-) comp14515_c0_seq4:106-1509(-)